MGSAVQAAEVGNSVAAHKLRRQSACGPYANAAYGYDVRSELVGETGSIFVNAPATTRCNSALKAFERYPADSAPALR